MRGKIIVGSIFSVCLLLLLPSIPAVEYKVATDPNEFDIDDLISNIKINLKNIKGKLKDIDSEELKEKLKNYDLEKIKDYGIQNYLSKLNKDRKDQNSEPNFIIILSLLKLIIRIIKFIVSLGGFIVSSIVNIIFLIGIVIFLIAQLIIILIVSVIQWVFSIFENIIDSILNFIRDIITPGQADALLVK